MLLYSSQIGDCYVAVTGLPEPQKDHAVIMCKFAVQCMMALNHLTMTLAESLGEETRNLSMRVGIHSGAVTAGVLRGHKARFQVRLQYCKPWMRERTLHNRLFRQLFGDSVNTASRMESNGVMNRIHVSQSTADALIQCGKKDWLEAREDRIVAKGKGEMQTYFVTVRDKARTASATSDYSRSLVGPHPLSSGEASIATDEQTSSDGDVDHN